MFDFLNLLDATPTSEILDGLKRLSSWSVVMRVIVVHISARNGAKTGLFGLLGDARIQLVDAFDKARVNAYFELAERCELKGNVTVKQDFHRDNGESMKLKLRDTLMLRFDSEELLPALHPVIMFHMCTEMCNHQDQGHDVSTDKPSSS